MKITQEQKNQLALILLEILEKYDKGSPLPVLTTLLIGSVEAICGE